MPFKPFPKKSKGAPTPVPVMKKKRRKKAGGLDFPMAEKTPDAKGRYR